MPLLDIATAQPSFPNHRFAVGFRSFHHVSFIFSNPHIKLGSSSSWRYFSLPDKGSHPSIGYVNTRGSGLMIKAVATLEPRYSVQRNDSLQLGTRSRNLPIPDNQSFGEDSEVIDEREKLRRLRISKANKGNTPWNKGRKHSPETLQRIRERTRLAMQDPKVKAKLVNLGHAQSEETRVKIGVGVRIGWERRREKLMLQETCHFEWQNLIAEASRKGLLGEEELQWDSYKIMDAKLKKEWLESVEERKRMPRLKGSKRAPKSPEQRRKISEAIAAKWADPTYRDRVFSGLSKYHGIIVGLEKPRKKPKSEGEPKKTSASKKKAKDSDDSTVGATKSQRPKLKRRNTPMYKDPLASSKLEMIKSIRAQRAAAESTKSEAVTRAKLLIAEAEKAADALEIAATKSPLAQASLLETRKLIAEAIKSIESIEIRDLEHGGSSSSTSNEKINHHTCETGTPVEDTDHKEVNGTMTLALTDKEIMDIGFSKLDLEDGDLPTTSDHHRILVNGKEKFYPGDDSGSGSSSSHKNGSSGDHPPNGHRKEVDPHPKKHETAQTSSSRTRTRTTKRWVRGKLVEVAEED